MSTSDVWIAAIRAREQAATKGPWTSEGGGEGVGPADLADAEFIAHARADIPALLATVDEARRVAVSLEAALARILNANDAVYADLRPITVTNAWYSGLTAAIESAREWVGTEARP